jgi:hypothetical protein
MESVSESIITFIIVVAGLFFSFSVGLLVEEFVFGGVFRLLAARGAVKVPVKTGHNH